MISVVLLIGIFLSLYMLQKNQSENDVMDLPVSFSGQMESSDGNDSSNTDQAKEKIEIKNEENESPTEKKGHWQTVTINEPAWDENILIKEGWTESVLVKDAWDEEDTYCSVYGQDSYNGYECNCGKVSGTLEEVLKHIDEDENCNSWHNKTIYYGESYCQAYQTDYIHHDAEYRQIYHEPEYKVIHHESKTYEKQVWVEE